MTTDNFTGKTYKKLLAGTLLIITIASGHASGIDPQPERPLPSGWIEADSDIPRLEIGEQWWKMFNDPVLDSLESIAVENSYDLASATRRISIARAQLNETRSGYFPQLGLSAGWTKQRSSGMNVSPRGDATDLSYFDAGISASWEIDIFGKIRTQSAGKKSGIRLSRAEYAGAMLSLTANVASAYFQLRIWQAELLVADEHSGRQDKVVKIAEARYEAGLSSMLDVTQAKGVYFSTRASVPVLENSISTAINSLAVMIGVYPDRISGILSSAQRLPDFTHLVATGYPADLLNRRPDVVAARYQIEMNAAELGVARKAYLPSLTIDGSIGTSAHSADDLFSKNSFTYSVAPRLSWSIFEGGARKAATTIARENMLVSIDSYNSTVMTAVEEVQNAIISYHNSLRHINAIQKTLEQSDKAYELSLSLYKRGLTPFNNVVTAQIDMLTNRNTLIVAHGQALVYLVDLCKALGGGWSE